MGAPPAADRETPAAIPDRALLRLLAAITALGPVSTNIYLPALPAVRDYFGASVSEVQVTFSAALATFAVGILLWGPISDRYGRRRAVLCGLGVQLIGALLCVSAQSLPWLIFGRAVVSFGTASGLVVARAIVVDRYPHERMAKALAYLTMVAVLGNSLAPVIGGYLTSAFGWRGVFVALLLAGMSIGSLAWHKLPETHRATTPTSTRGMLGVAVSLLRKPDFTGSVLQSTVIYASFLVIISLAPYVMVSALGRPPTEFGYYYLFIAVGYFFGNWSVARFLGRHDVNRMVVVGVALTVLGSVAAVAAIAAGGTHPLWIFVPVGVLSYGQGLALPNIIANAVSLAPQHAGVGSSLLGFMQQIVGAMSVQAMSVFPTDTAMPMLLFCAIACVTAFALLWAFPKFEALRR